MQTRMDKYNTSDLSVNSRTEKNKELYDTVKNSSMDGYDIKSNIAVLDENASSINVLRVKEMLDKRYSENAPKRVSISLPEENSHQFEETIEPTKEYDINAVLEKAKKGKNIDYNQERLKKVRETQYEILNNLELKDLEEEKNPTKEKEEKNLMNLINTITNLEEEYKTSQIKKDTESALELLSDLKDDEPTILPDEIKIEEPKKEVKVQEQSQKIEKKDNVEETLSKLEIDYKKYDDFKDISTTEPSSIVIKIILIIVVIILVCGCIYILDNILSLGLF